MWPHVATVKRLVRTITNATESAPVLTTISTSWPCLVEGLSAYRQATVFADLSGFTLTFSWPESAGELQEDDEITLSHKAGKTYYLKLSVDDTHRPTGMTTIEPYYVGNLVQEAMART